MANHSKRSPYGGAATQTQSDAEHGLPPAEQAAEFVGNPEAASAPDDLVAGGRIAQTLTMRDFISVAELQGLILPQPIGTEIVLGTILGIVDGIEAAKSKYPDQNGELRERYALKGEFKAWPKFGPSAGMELAGRTKAWIDQRVAEHARRQLGLRKPGDRLTFALHVIVTRTAEGSGYRYATEIARQSRPINLLASVEADLARNGFDPRTSTPRLAAPAAAIEGTATEIAQ